jgi:hypothetical protein
MTLGFELFSLFAAALRVHEVFPSASYRQLRGEKALCQIDLGGFFGGPKDMLDAYVCAITAREFEQGRGCAIGDGDGLGAIILPRKLADPIDPVVSWRDSTT